MVLQRERFDWHNIHFDRSTGWALAVAVNVLFLMLLTLPTRPTVSLPAPATAPTAYDWIELRPQPPAPPVPPPPAAPPRPVVSEVLVSPAPPVERAVLEATPPPLEMQSGDPGPVLEQATPSAQAAVAPTGNAEASIDYDFAPAPPYPRSELQRGVEGTVVLRIEVDGEGRVMQVEIQHSSGNRRLDRAAQQQVARHWRFKPALRDGRPVAGWVRVPIEFSLQR